MSVIINMHTAKYQLLALRCASCLQCFDAVGWAAGRASGL